MPKLTRYLQKIFANNSNEVGVFGTGVDKETSKNVETLQSADYEDGWSSAIITNKNYPIWQEMDGVQYGLSYQLKYLFQNGIPEWLSTETYYTNSYCRVGSNVYYSLQDDNINHNPALNDGWWTPLLTSNRSIGEIIPSAIPLTDAGLHLLDGSLIQGNGVYSDFVSYMGDLYNTTAKTYKSSAFTVVGSPNITDDGIASGFSASNYITTPSSAFSTASSYKFRARVKSPNSTDTLLGWNMYFSQGYAGYLALNSNYPQQICYNCQTGSDTFLSFTYDYDTWYDIEWGYNGSQMFLNYKKTTESTYTELTGGNSSDKYSSDFITYIGNFIEHQFPAVGSIDLKNFSISVDGTQVLSGSDRTGFCLESEWQQSVSTYGVCGKFVYEPSSNTVRLPKVTGIIEGTTDLTALGDLVEAGLPNITGGFQNFDIGGTYGVFSETSWGSRPPGHPGDHDGSTVAVSFDASRSSSIYGNSTTVQPQTIKVLYYIVVATSIKTDIEVDIDEIVSDLNNKLDRDGSNAPNKISDALLSKWLPDYANGITITSGFTAPSMGWISIAGYTETIGDNNYVYINGIKVSGLPSGGGQVSNSTQLPINKNDVVTFNNGAYTMLFFPMKGAN